MFGTVAHLPSDGRPYLVFTFAALTGWNLFSGILARAASCLVGNANLVSRVYFPRLILPLSVPGLISAGIFAFTLSWNEFIYALTFISSSEVKTVPVGVVTELVEGDVYHWGSLMSGALLGSLPVAVMYSFFVEHYVSGMTGAVKE